MVKSRGDTLHFWDGVRKIDIVLAYHEDDDDDHSLQKLDTRKIFQRNLVSQGLELEIEPSKRSADKKTSFLKIHAPTNVLRKYGEIMNLKLPVKKFTTIFYSDKEVFDEEEEERGFFEPGSFFYPFELDSSIIPPEPNLFVAGLNLNNEDRFVTKERELEFSSAQRSMIVWQILNRTRFDEDRDSGCMGIHRLLAKSVYEAAYPLHDGRYDRPRKNGELSQRRILYTEWANGRRWYKKQPLWYIKEYFGEKVGLYFAWLGFYTTMLIPAAVVGVIVFLYGMTTIEAEWNHPSNEICDKENAGNLTMCPQCTKYCNFWKLSDSCRLSKLTHVFDNSSTVFFSIFMSLWATAFLEFWKRKQAIIAWEWDLSNFEEVEPIRPEFEASVKTTRINPVNKKHEPYLPPWNRAMRVVFTSSFIVFMLLVVAMAVFAVMLYRVTVTVFLNKMLSTQENMMHSQVKLIVAFTAGCMNLSAIMVLNNFYEYIAIWLTNLEQPRTYTDFEGSYTFKVYLFQCINYYSSLVYIAFFKGKFFSHPGGNSIIKSSVDYFSTDICDPAGCFYELFLQLAIIMVGKQTMNNIIEFIIPKVVTMWKRYVYHINAVDDDESNNGAKVFTRWEMDYNLKSVDRLALLDEYLEMVIQYGFVTLFVAAFPLAPFFALVNNIIEIRLDAYKYTTTMRRPLAQRTEDIGAWLGILQTITYISVIFNGITIALASDFIPRIVYSFVHSEDSSLKGFIEFSLTKFNTSDWGDKSSPEWPGPIFLQNSTIPDSCYFKALREEGPEYKLAGIYFHVFSARLAFVLIFEHFVLGIIGLVSVLIPDIPKDIKVQIQRENHLSRELLFEATDRNENNSAFQSFRKNSRQFEEDSSPPKSGKVLRKEIRKQTPSTPFSKLTDEGILEVLHVM